jgi:uncharacterized membrane protein
LDDLKRFPGILCRGCGDPPLHRSWRFDRRSKSDGGADFRHDVGGPAAEGGRLHLWSSGYIVFYYFEQSFLPHLERSDMEILLLGLALFLGIHLLPVLTGVRQRLFAALGEKGYKGLFSLISALGLVLIVFGYARAPAEPRLFAPLQTAIRIAPLVMLVVFVLLAAANMRTHIRRGLRHPMLLGVGLWALVHLLANGELRTTWLFGAFLAYVVIDLVSVVRRGAVKSFRPVLRQDVIALLAGIALALLVMAFHRRLFGVAAVPWGI